MKRTMKLTSKRTLAMAGIPVLVFAAWAMAQPAGDPLIEGFRGVEVASVSDAMEQLYGQRGYMAHDMRPLAMAKFAGPAVTVQLKKRSTRMAHRRRRACWTRLTARLPVRSM